MSKPTETEVLKQACSAVVYTVNTFLRPTAEDFDPIERKEPIDEQLIVMITASCLPLLRFRRSVANLTWLLAEQAKLYSEEKAIDCLARALNRLDPDQLHKFIAAIGEPREFVDVSWYMHILSLLQTAAKCLSKENEERQHLLELVYRFLEPSDDNHDEAVAEFLRGKNVQTLEELDLTGLEALVQKLQRSRTPQGGS